ncbi:unnamed protein product [Callosobruchus maculatus]|uniref:Ig-like domain-containing protein n=1 Tax=Callosobruchus maculatus TaxID=64391 RepID=A0A653DKI8_CALMS|nr:unnamed protein product [Callosobruchus maculatus]
MLNKHINTQTNITTIYTTQIKFCPHIFSAYINHIMMVFLCINKDIVQIQAIDRNIHYLPRENFKLVCNVTYSKDDPTPEVRWMRDGTAVTAVDGLKARAKVRWDSHNHLSILTVEGAKDEDAGNYSCIAFDKDVELMRDNVRAARPLTVKTARNLNFVEEEKLRITCKPNREASIYWVFQSPGIG